MAIQIFITGAITASLNVSTTDTIEIVKQKIQDRESIPPDQQILLFNGVILNNDRTLADYGIVEGSILTLRLVPTPPPPPPPYKPPATICRRVPGCAQPARR
jgi:hypothetical protein